MLIFLGVLSVFTILSSSFTKSNCRNFIANDEWPLVSDQVVKDYRKQLQLACVDILNNSIIHNYNRY